MVAVFVLGAATLGTVVINVKRNACGSELQFEDAMVRRAVEFSGFIPLGFH